LVRRRKMENLDYTEAKTRWQEIRLFLGIRGIPLSEYDRLPPHLKTILHKCICTPTQVTTDRQRSELYTALTGNMVAGRGDIDTLTPFLVEERENFLRPITENEKQEYISKF
jgi:hypothetical protein